MTTKKEKDLLPEQEAEETKAPARRRRKPPSESPEEEKRSVSKPPEDVVLSIDEHLGVETDEEKARNDLIDLLESQKSGRLLTGTIRGIERSESSGDAFAVLYHGNFKIIIPVEEAVDSPHDFHGMMPQEMLNNMLNKRMGAEIDYVIKGIDPESGIAAASRLEAMRAKRKRYFLTPDRDGNYLIYSGVRAEVRVTSVARSGIFVELFGLETFIPIRELSYQRMVDPGSMFQPGQRILVRVLNVDRTDPKEIKAEVSVKQAGENPYERAFQKYVVGNCYVGTVTVVDTTGVFVALDEGIDCLCSYPKRGRPPRGSRVAVRILGSDSNTNRIWGAIFHVALPK